jgi:hypothetical protein
VGLEPLTKAIAVETKQATFPVAVVEVAAAVPVPLDPTHRVLDLLPTVALAVVARKIQ